LSNSNITRSLLRRKDHNFYKRTKHTKLDYFIINKNSRILILHNYNYRMRISNYRFVIIL